jgi:CRISPR/Cas system-associated exonuclease Cas4 (RecB family)
VDGIIKWGAHKPYELKSISPERYEFRKAYKKPDENTYRQTQLYLKALDYDDSFVIYENKGNQEILIFDVLRDDEFIKKELKRLQKIYDMYQTGTMPKRPYLRQSKQCQDCEFEITCWDVLDD